MSQTSKDLLKQMSDAPNMSEEEALALQQKFCEEHGLTEGDENAKINAAARLLMTGKHQEAIVAYTAVAEQHPDQTGTCEGQIGAAYFFLGDYEKALSFYEAAKEHGADADMMNDNIEEAKEAIEKVARGEDPNEEGGGIGIGTILLVALVIAAIVKFVL